MPPSGIASRIKSPINDLKPKRQRRFARWAAPLALPVSLPLAMILAGQALSAGFARQAQADPSWYKKKKKEEAQKEAEERAKDAEAPAVGPGSDESDALQPTLLGPPPGPPPSKNLLFKASGLTDSLGLDYGTLNQPEINGKALSINYSLGWWWQPELILSGFARESTIITGTYLFMFVGVGPELRYFATKNFALSGFLGYGFSQGLSRVDITNVPRPPSETELQARIGLFAGVQAAYLFWIKRDMGIGPSITYYRGSQRERAFDTLTFGITYQAGKPTYGDLTR